MERALETQRLALLRLLTGLAVALSLVAFAPAVSMLPRSVRSYVASLLERVEAAVHSLVIVAACGLLRRSALVSSGGLSFPPLARAVSTDGRLSSAALLRRIVRLRAVLEDLPCHAKRMIVRMMKPKTEPRESLVCWDRRAEALVVAEAPLAARIERPPDKRRRSDEIDFGFIPS